MSDRDVPFDEFAVCDSCKKVGAFDFMGDFYCAECLKIDDDEPLRDDEFNVEIGE